MTINACISGIAGRMGCMLSDTATRDPELKVVSGIEFNTDWIGKIPMFSPDQVEEALANANVLVIFSNNPNTVVEQARTAVSLGVVPVIGTTKLSEACLQELKRLSVKVPVVQAYNFSPGATLFIAKMAEFARALRPWTVKIVDIHHAAKQDWPSGTAIKLAESICDGLDWVYYPTIRKRLLSGNGGIEDPRTPEVLIYSIRAGEFPGFHEVTFYLAREKVVFTHDVSDRSTFALGAWQAVKWALRAGRNPGLYDMVDVLGLK